MFFPHGEHGYLLVSLKLQPNTSLSCLHFLEQVKLRKKLKSSDKDNGPTSPTVPSITFDSVFDSGREMSSDVYSTVGTGTKTYWKSEEQFLEENRLMFVASV